MLRTIDELAELSEEPAVRRRFDLRNVVIVRWLFVFFMVVLLAMTAEHSSDGGGGVAAITGTALVIVLTLFLAFRRVEPRQTEPRERARWLEWLARRLSLHLRATTLVYLVLQYLVVILGAFGSDNVIPWFMVFPLITLVFRFAPSEFMLLHGIFAGTVLVERWIYWAFVATGSPLTGVIFSVFLPAFSINAITLGIELFLTRRYRRDFLKEWAAARASFQERSRMRQELEFAREIQLSMLPRESPDLDWIDIATVSLPASEVGGDYYDFFPIDEDRMAIVVGDVAGHGLASGIVLSGVRSCLTLLEKELVDPVSVIRRIHEMIRKTARHRMLVTLSILLLDRSSNRAILTSAGHPPIIRRRSSGEIEEIGISALPLGAPMLEDFELREFTLGENDVLFLQTDGVYEMRDEEGESFGLERLAERVQSHDPADGSRSLRDAVIRDLWEFRGRAVQEDDLTILVLTWGAGRTQPRANQAGPDGLL